MANRLFTFGCSFTQYLWPTWADILGKGFEYYENWGKAGGGNQYIFNSLMECYLQNQLDSNDTVIIMWTSTDREDRYINGIWQTPGGLEFQTFYDKSFISKYYDERGSLFRDLTYIQATKDLLDFWGVKYKFLSMAPFDDKLNIDLMIAFNSVIKTISESAYDVLYNKSWFLPKHQFEFAQTMDKENHINILKETYVQFAGTDWPNFSDFIADKIDKKFKIEMQDFGLLYLRDYPLRADSHPCPKEHLIYLKTVLPEYKIDTATEDWINNYKLFNKFKKHQPTTRL